MHGAVKHEPVHEVRDAVYGFVKLTEAEWKIVNSPPFQRLRNIRQLGMGHMVYPGANHTRFEHSIGCVHLATRILAHLWEQDKDRFSWFGITDDAALQRARRILRLAALLHDVGHPPFSHTAEKDILPTGKYNKVKTQLDHEHMTSQIIRSQLINCIIEQHYKSLGVDAEVVIAVATKPSLAKPKSDASKEPMYSFLNSILAGDLGADRIDYLLRDAKHSGQPTGVFDYARLIDTMAIVDAGQEEQPSYPTLGLTEQGWLTAEQMIVARYLMYLTVYFHKTKRAFEHHTSEFLKARLPGGVLPVSVKAYLRWDDIRVNAAAQAAARKKNSDGHEAAKRLVGRNHWRLAHEIVLADCCRETDGRRTPDKETFEAFRNALEEKFRQRVFVDEISHSATKMFEPEARIRVRFNDRTRYLDDLSEIVRGMSSSIWRGRVYCDANDKNQVRQWCRDWFEENAREERNKAGRNPANGG